MSTTWSAPVDLDNCATEPIHVPGSIQPHGVLIAVTEPDLTVAIASANLDETFDVSAAEAIGVHLSAVIGTAGSGEIDSARMLDWERRFDEVAFEHRGAAFVSTLFRSGPYLVIEIERDDKSDSHGGTLVREAAMALQAAGTVLEVADVGARWIRSLSGFDRVMVYRFDGDWNGEVVAERKRDDLNSFFGLHYPATDIPAQARELYRRNWLRVIPHIGYIPVPLVPAVAHETDQPLDLSGSALRSVSPIHVEYLENMGVGASMSVSIIIAGELWGLIACHHYSGAHYVDTYSRNAAEFLGQLISLRISETLEADERSRVIELNALGDRVSEAFAAASPWQIDEILHAHESELLAMAGATGMIVRASGVASSLGSTPSMEVIDEVLSALPTDRDLFVTDHMAEAFPDVQVDRDVASGMLALGVLRDRTEFVAWFRPEIVRSVDWGGDPHNAKLAAAEGDSIRLSPRKSFELWRENVHGRSEPWDDSTVQAAQRFVRHLTAALLRNQRDAATLAHDLQRVMRPDALPRVAGYELSVFSQAAGHGDIGGDWYDALQLDEHRVSVVVGDVAGHGLTAASQMAQIRNVLRAFVFMDGDPVLALQRLDAYMIHSLPGSVATAVCAVIDTSTSVMTISHAGHLPALIVRNDGANFVELDGDPLLGYRESVRRSRQIPLARGDIVVLYSDGLVETRQLPIDIGLERLRGAASDLLGRTSAGGGAVALASRLIRDDHQDDISLFLVRRV